MKSDYSSQPSANSSDHHFILQPIKTVNGEVIIKKYRKLKKVGEGSYSKCYLVQTVNSDSTYVVKIIPKKKLEVLIKEKLVYEIKIHKSLLNKNVVHLDHWFEDQSFQYIFMEYCSNGNLQTRMQDLKLFSQDQIRNYAFQVLEGLIYIHSKLVLHRDLKLCNFYLDQNDQVKIGDFGFACQLSHPDQKKRQTCGTPNYIAPEAISGFGYSFSADVWGFGVMLYRMKFQQCPFQGKTVAQTLQNVKLCRYDFPKRKIGNQLKDLIQKIFNLNYDQRLSLHEIRQHPFFCQQVSSTLPDVENIKEEKKKPQRGFSLGRLISSLGKDKKEDRKTDNNQKLNSSNKKQQKQKQVSPKNRPKRSNSCETFKQIKQIMKSKTTNSSSNQVYPTSMRTDFNSQQHITLTSVNQTSRQLGGAKTMRNIIQMSTLGGMKRDDFSMISNGSMGVRSNKIQEFLKNQQNSVSLKDQMRKSRIENKQGNVPNTTKSQLQRLEKQDERNKVQIGLKKQNEKILAYDTSSKNYQFQKSYQKLTQNLRSFLLTIKHHFILPERLQMEKDITIVHFQPDLKQVIYGKGCFYLYKSKDILYNVSGNQQEEATIDKLPKVLRYVLQNNIQLERNPEQNGSNEDVLEQTFAPSLHQLIHKLPSSYCSTKQALLLKYTGKDSNVIWAKMTGQQSYYVQSEKNSVMFQQGYKVVEGVVVHRIYQGLVKSYIKKL